MKRNRTHVPEKNQVRGGPITLQKSSGSWTHQPANWQLSTLCQRDERHLVQFPIC
jgi:hypothetical protein